MSAWLVSNFHINAIVSWAQRNNLELPRATPEEVTRMLTDENMRSLNHRYDETAEWTKDAATYRFTPVSQEELKTMVKTIVAKRNKQMPRYPQKLPPMTDKVVAAAVAHACDCYDYQACETDNYDQTEAAAFVDAVRSAAVSDHGPFSKALFEVLPWGLD